MREGAYHHINFVRHGPLYPFPGQEETRKYSETHPLDVEGWVKSEQGYFVAEGSPAAGIVNLGIAMAPVGFSHLHVRSGTLPRVIDSAIYATYAMRITVNPHVFTQEQDQQLRAFQYRLSFLETQRGKGITLYERQLEDQAEQQQIRIELCQQLGIIQDERLNEFMPVSRLPKEERARLILQPPPEYVRENSRNLFSEVMEANASLRNIDSQTGNLHTYLFGNAHVLRGLVWLAKHWQKKEAVWPSLDELKQEAPIERGEYWQTIFNENSELVKGGEGTIATERTLINEQEGYSSYKERL